MEIRRAYPPITEAEKTDSPATNYDQVRFSGNAMSQVMEVLRDTRIKRLITKIDKLRGTEDDAEAYGVHIGVLRPTDTSIEISTAESKDWGTSDRQVVISAEWSWETGQLDVIEARETYTADYVEATTTWNVPGANNTLTTAEVHRELKFAHCHLAKKARAKGRQQRSADRVAANKARYFQDPARF